MANGPGFLAFFKVQAFLAFAYTYHYLNWFSKTLIIKWHQVAKKKFGFWRCSGWFHSRYTKWITAWASAAVAVFSVLDVVGSNSR